MLDSERVGATGAETATVDVPRVERYVPRSSVEVWAMAWDGTEGQARAVVAWVKSTGSGNASYGIDGIFVEQWPAQPVWLEPGMVLVRHPGVGWSQYPRQRFNAEFRRLTRELPIFDSGEVV